MDRFGDNWPIQCVRTPHGAGITGQVIHVRTLAPGMNTGAASGPPTGLWECVQPVRALVSRRFPIATPQTALIPTIPATTVSYGYLHLYLNIKTENRKPSTGMEMDIPKRAGTGSVVLDIRQLALSSIAPQHSQIPCDNQLDNAVHL